MLFLSRAAWKNRFVWIVSWSFILSIWLLLLSFCVKKTQPALKRGKAGCDNKMKFFIFKPVMLAQKQKALGSLPLSAAEEINAVFCTLTVETCYPSAFWGNKLLMSLHSFTAVYSLKMSLSAEGNATSIYLTSTELICVNSL